MTKIKTLIAAIDAEQLAVEAKKRANLKSQNKKDQNKKDQNKIPDLVKKALEKRQTQAQVKQALLKEKWRPPGYISRQEAEAAACKDWNGE